jgi:L-methionine (R)-S-oxide reductase
MVSHTTFSGDRTEDYALLLRQAPELWEKDLPLHANLANMSALLKQSLGRTNWAGFYLWDSTRSQLLLGPFQGRPACTRIALGKGVCGTAASTRKTQRVADVHQFPGHIACDAASNSEIVVPMVKNGTLLGVLDVDSPELSRFDAADQSWLERFVGVLVSLWPGNGPEASR